MDPFLAYRLRNLRLSAASAVAGTTRTADMTPEQRDAYLSAYSSRLNRHGLPSVLSATKTAVETTKSTSVIITTASSAAEKAERAANMSPSDAFFAFLVILLKILWLMARHTVYYVVLPAVLFWIFFGLVNWRRRFAQLGQRLRQDVAIFGEIAVGIVRAFFALLFGALLRLAQELQLANRLLALQDAVREPTVATTEWIGREINNLRFNPATDTLYLQYQLAVNWIGDHKAHLIVSLVALHLVSGRLQADTNDIDRFMIWPELQRYLDKPMPEILLRQRLEYGSNSHYYREIDELIEHDSWAEQAIESKESLEIEHVIEEVVETNLEHNDTTELAPGNDHEIRRTVDGMVYCKECRQRHCCELPY